MTWVRFNPHGDVAFIVRRAGKRCGVLFDRPPRYRAPRHTFAVYRQLGAGRWYWQGPDRASGNGWGQVSSAHYYTSRDDAAAAMVRHHIVPTVFSVGVVQVT